MKPGQLVELRGSPFGLSGNNLLAIFVDRFKRKKDYIAVVHTVKGRKEVRPSQISRRQFHQRCNPGLKVPEMDATLTQWIKDISEGEGTAIDEEGGGNPDELSLWRSLVEKWDGEEAWTVSELADHGGISKKAAEDVLEKCEGGRGHFVRVQRRPDRWKPISVDQRRAILDQIEALHALRNVLVPKTTYLDEDGIQHMQRLPPEEVELGESEDTFSLVAQLLGDYVRLNRWSDVGLGGTEITVFEGFALHRWLAQLCEEYTGDFRPPSRSSLFASFLIDRGVWDARALLEALEQRQRHAHPAFSLDGEEAAFREAANFPEPKDDDQSGRRDLRDLETYTIDPPTAKDFDDAVSLVENGDGSRSLWVHIADVSHYVKPDERLDRWARKRSTSVYLPTGVWPMLPPRLSEDLCSLNSGDPRFAMSVRLDYDGSGKRTGFEVTPALIDVNENLSYDQVNGWLEEGKSPFTDLDQLAEGINGHRRSLHLELGELRLNLDSPDLDLVAKFSSPATRMIETFMVSANEAVAEWLVEKGCRGLFRCHPLPDPPNVTRFNAQMETMEYEIRLDLPEYPGRVSEPTSNSAGGGSLLESLMAGGSLTLGAGLEITGPGEDDEEDSTPPVSGLAQVSEEEQDAWMTPYHDALAELDRLEKEGPKHRARVARQKVLNTFARAFYTARNMGHFGLGLTHYAHFTSPIRRYPDVIVHRQIRAALEGEEDPYGVEELDEIGQRCTDNSVDAERMERALTNVGQALRLRNMWMPSPKDRYLDEEEQTLPEPLPSTASSITSGGVFFTADDRTETRVPTRLLTSRSTTVDEAESRLEEVSEDPRQDGEVLIRIGDRRSITPSEFDLIEGRIGAR